MFGQKTLSVPVALVKIQLSIKRQPYSCKLTSSKFTNNKLTQYKKGLKPSHLLLYVSASLSNRF